MKNADSDLIVKAQIFAMEAHKGLVRPNRAKEPYSHHLKEVATLVQITGGNAEEIAAAWLHDVVEDTDTTLEKIEEHFGQRIARIVSGLTDPPQFEHMDISARKRAQSERVREENARVKRVKLADQTSNLLSMAIDPLTHWDTQKCLYYVKGAGLIARECRGISASLDSIFERAYHAALHTYS